LPQRKDHGTCGDAASGLNAARLTGTTPSASPLDAGNLHPDEWVIPRRLID